MKTIALASALLAASLASAAMADQPLTPERVFASPDLSGPAARGVQVSPDGKLVTFLKAEPGDQYKLDLWIGPVGGGAPRLLVSGEAVEPSGQALSEAEKSRRERQRTAALSGVLSYQWDELGRRILIPAGGALYSADPATGQVSKLKVGGPGVIDAKISPAGGYASYVRDQNLYVLDFAGGRERAITTAGKDLVSYGVAEFIAQEEMGRYTGYWWAPGDRAIAFARVDESPVEVAQRLEIGTEGASVTQERYPRAGTANARVSLFVQGLEARAQPVAVDLGADPDTYLARVDWSADGRELYVQRESRDQKTLDLLRVEPTTGHAQVIVTEHAEPWVNLTDDFHPLKDGDFIWASSRSGANQLYLYHRDGRLVRALTEGDAPVMRLSEGHSGGLVGVDETRGLVYFMASRETPIERQLYVVSYREPGAPRAVTEGHGWWNASMPKSADVFVGYYSDPDTPPQTGLYDAHGKRLAWIEENRLDPGHPYHPYAGRYPAPEFGTLKSADGQDLHYVLLKPAGFDPARKYPAIVEVYGGPDVQTVTRSWRSPREKLYLEAGYVLFQLDNRGSSNRDMRFEGAIAGRLGSVEVDDQVTGIDWLRAQPFVKADAVGVSGWSYGGYMTLRLLTDPRTGLKAGASGAPPTDWRQYDTHYTERFMGKPQDQAAAYDAAMVTGPRLEALKGRLLLMQGMADDNVQFANSIAVMAQLQAEGVAFDLMLYPGQRHGVAGPQRLTQLWRTYLEFFARELGGAPPPP